MAEREARLDRYLAIELESKQSESDEDEERDESAVEFIADDQPIWIAPLNVNFIEWVYIIDLDREIFSVNNGAHYKLDRIPHINWIESLANGALGDKISLPVVGNDMASLVAEVPETGSRESQAGYNRQVVTPKSIMSIPWRRRHGPILRQLVFRLWAKSVTEGLAATLLQCVPEDLPFREMAYVAPCLASSGKHLQFLPERFLTKSVVHGFIEDPDRSTSLGQEFVSVLATGAHLHGNIPGSAPQETIYSLDGVLVMLTAQLFRPNAVHDGISLISDYCQKNRPGECIDAVLMSIEHVVLVHVSTHGIQNTRLLPLVDIPNHLSMDVRDRYASWYLKGLERRKQEIKQRREMDEEDSANSGMEESDYEIEELSRFGDPALYRTSDRQPGDNPVSTFYALNQLFEAAARRPLKRASVRNGRFPSEIYAQILMHVTDGDTRDKCMKVSRTFQDLCQEQILLNETLMIGPSEACKEPGYRPTSFDRIDLALHESAPEWFNMIDLLTNTKNKVRFESAERRRKRRRFLEDRPPPWIVLVGSERNQRSLLHGLKFRFTDVERLKE